MGLVEGVWIVGIIDEIQMLEINTTKIPMLIDTKTRVRDTIPAVPQRRNGKYVIVVVLFKPLEYQSMLFSWLQCILI